MGTQEYLEEMKSLQAGLLRFIECEDNIEDNFQALINLLNEKKICDDKRKFTAFLHLLSKISNNHHRENDFFSKIEQIITKTKEKIVNNFSNLEIFNIFKSNKRVLLFLHDEKIIKIDENISKRLISNKYFQMHYPHYFLPEIKPYIKKKWFEDYEIAYYNNDCVKSFFDSIDKDLPENFYENRKKGENESDICEFIRNDSIKEFIIYHNKNSISLHSEIQPSIYETNLFLLKKQNKKPIKLIEYAAFYGSIQIFNFLRMNNIELTESLWLYSIHGGNGEIIHLLEENHIDPPKNEIYFEAIKSHHNDIANYIMNLNIENKEEEKSQYFAIRYLKYFNFIYVQNEMINESLFYDLCQYDHPLFVHDLLKEENIDINKEIKREEYEVVEFEWTKENHITDDKEYSLFRAVEKENIEIIKLLLARDSINVNIINQCSYELWSFKKTALFAAVEKENIEIIKLLLLNEKIDVNKVNKIEYNTGSGSVSRWCYTALYESIDRENIEIIKLLLTNSDIDVNSDNKKHEDHEGGGEPNEGKFLKTPLYRAIEKENIEIVKLLLKSEEIDIDIINSKEGKEDYDEVLWKKTAFFKAVEKENIEIIKLLLTEDFDINIKNYDSGELDEDDIIDIKNIHRKKDEIKGTALFLAVMKKNIKIIKLLLTNLNNDLNIRGKINGKKTTVLELAATINDDEITKILSDYKIKQSNKQTIDEGFNIFDKIEKIFYNFHPDLEITFKTRKYLNHFIDRLLEKVAQKMEQIIEKNDQKEINCADIEKILSCFHMPGDVLNAEIRAAYKYVDKFHSNEKPLLDIPVNTIQNYIQKRITNGKINDDVYYFIQCAIEVLLYIILEDSGNVSRDHCRECASLRSTFFAFIEDEELSFLFQNIYDRELRKNFIQKPYKANRWAYTFLK